MKRFWLFVFLVLGHHAIFAQLEYTTFHYTQKNGLPQNSVNDLYWDNQHFLWLCTEAGLVRYDGNSFYTFNKTNTPSINNERFRWILENDKGTILTTNSSGSIFSIKDHQLNPTGFNTTYGYTYVKGIIPSNKTFSSLLKLSLSDCKNKKWKVVPLYVSSFEGRDFVLGKSHIYIINQNQILDSISHNTYINGIMHIGKALYAYSETELFHVDVKNHLLHKVNIQFPSPAANQFYQSNGYTFILNNKRLYQIVRSKKPTALTLIKKLNIEPISIEGISNIAYDSALNTFAIGSITNGFYIFKPRYFYTKYQKPKVGEHGYYSQVALNDSTILTTYNDVFTPNQTSQSTFDLTYATPQVALYDKHHVLWTAQSHAILYQKKGQERKSIPIADDSDIDAIIEFGDSIIAINNKLVYILYQFKCIDSINLKYAEEVKKESNTYPVKIGRSILLGLTNGVYMLDIDSPIVFKKIFNYNQVRYLLPFRDWIIGTSYGDGVFVIRNNKLTQLTTDKEQYLKKAHSVQITPMGLVFISTNSGLFYTTVDEITSFLDGKIDRIYYKYFSESDGIDNTEFNGGCIPSSVALKNGYFSFSNMGGLVWFKPNLLPLATQTPKIFHLDEVKFDEQYQAIADSFTIPANIENVTIKLGYVYWHNPYDIRLQYKLSGFNKDWITVNSISDPISFTNLPVGNYKFIVKAQTGFTQNDVSEYVIYFKKLPKYYETTWFILLCVLGILTLIIIATRLYNKQLRNNNLLLEKRVNERTYELQHANKNLQQSEIELLQSVNVKNKLISIISHDIVTPLKFISIVSRNFKSETKEHTAEKEVIREIHHTSQRLFDNAQNILNWVRYQNNLIKVNKITIAPFAVADEIADLFSEIAIMRKNIVLNQVDMDDIIQTDKTIFTIILQNLVSNAVKYTHSSTIIISSRKQDSKYIITISDDGQGINQNTLNRIFSIRDNAKTNIFNDSADGTGLGYIIIFELADLIGAEVVIYSDSNGTKVDIIF